MDHLKLMVRCHHSLKEFQVFRQSLNIDAIDYLAKLPARHDLS